MACPSIIWLVPRLFLRLCLLLLMEGAGALAEAVPSTPPQKVCVAQRDAVSQQLPALAF